MPRPNRLVLYGIPLALVVATAGCDTTDSRLANVQVSFATQGPTAALQRLALGDTIVEGANTLVITRAEIVLREIELRRAEQVSCDTDDCEEFETGPVLVDLPLDAGPRGTFALAIPPGLYDEIEFDLHEPDGNDPADLAFLAAHPEFEGISIRVQGTFNGEPFVFTTDLSVSQELTLVPALEIVDAISATNITILVHLAAWFRDDDGVLIHPALANAGGPFESDVRNNIQSSIEAFEDADEDGAES